MNGLSSAEESWILWQGWVKEDNFYPEGVFFSGEMWKVLKAMSETPLTKFGVGIRGTQLKASVVLLGGQKAVFKPKRSILTVEEVVHVKVLNGRSQRLES